jgi:hypothetical protein
VCDCERTLSTDSSRYFPALNAGMIIETNSHISEASVWCMFASGTADIVLLQCPIVIDLVCTPPA